MKNTSWKVGKNRYPVNALVDECLRNNIRVFKAEGKSPNAHKIALSCVVELGMIATVFTETPKDLDEQACEVYRQCVVIIHAIETLEWERLAKKGMKLRSARGEQ